MLFKSTFANVSALISALFLTGYSFQSHAATNSTNQCHASYQVKITSQTKFVFEQTSVTRLKFDSFFSMKPLSNTLADLPSRVKLPEGVTASWWGLQLTEVQQVANQQLLPTELAYSLPFAVLRSSEGKVLDFRFPVDLTADEKDKLKGFSYYLQFPTDKSQISTDLTRFEVDGVGQAEVLYSSQLDKSQKTVNDFVLAQGNDDKLFTFSKSKLSYQDTQSTRYNKKAQQVQNDVNILDSSQLVTINDCWLESTRGRETLYITSSAADYEMEVGQVFSLNKSPSLKDSLLWQLPDDYNLWKLQESEEVQLTEAELKAMALRMKQALGEIDILEMRGSILGEWLKQFDPVIDQMAVLLKSGIFDDKQTMRIYNALGQMDTPNSNRLVVSLIVDTELSETDRFRAIRAITNGESALTPELKEQLVNSILLDEFEGPEDLKGAAIMTLGAVIQYREPNEQSDQLLIDITNSLTNSENEEEQAALIASLGNSTQPDVLDTLKTYANSDSPRLRSNVASSLAQVGTEKAQELFSGMLHSEENPRAQFAILGAASAFELSENDMTKITDIALNSDSQRTRGNAIKAIAKQTHHPELAMSQLKNMMKKESSRQNFVKAAQALNKLKKQTSEQSSGNGG